MDDVRVGRLLRALRRRKALRQTDIARIAGVSQASISLIERGHFETQSLRLVRRVFGAVDAKFESSVTWRGGLVDRLLDERHAELVGAVAARLARAGWDVQVEVSFSVYGERGSIDVLATRPADRLGLVVEVKTELTSIEATIRRLDVKDRLGAAIIRDRSGWKPIGASRLLVILDGATSRRRVWMHDRSLSVAFPDRGAAVREWLRHPIGRISGLLFMEPGNPSGSGRRSPGSGQVPVSYEPR